MVYLYNGTFLALKRNVIWFMLHEDEPWQHYARGKSNIKGYLLDDYIYM